MKLYTEHMLVCPKCKNMNISGPVYKRSSGRIVHFRESLTNIGFAEHMEWTCGNSFDNFRDFKENDCPEGVTIGPILHYSEKPHMTRVSAYEELKERHRQALARIDELTKTLSAMIADLEKLQKTVDDLRKLV